MTILYVVGAIMLWLGLGGWTFRVLAPDTERGLTNGLILGCIVIAPFLAGLALADLQFRKNSTMGINPNASNSGPLSPKTASEEIAASTQRKP